MYYTIRNEKFHCKFYYGLFSFLFLFASTLFPNAAYAEAPKPEFILALSNSLAKVYVVDQNGQNGIGSGVVVAPNRLATNCHVVANARGISVSKLGNSYAPLAMKADWHHDLCILVFDDLPLKPFEFGDTAALQYEQHVFALSYSGNSPRPVESFGTVKALIPLDDSVLVRTTAGFRMGASGGALLDYDGKLVGFTTFKSPGRQGYYYSLPVAWVKKLLDQPEVTLTAEMESPFWAVPETERPYFMQVVQPLQTEAWTTLEGIAKAWTSVEKDNPEAWLYLGMAEQGLKELDQAKQTYNKVLTLAPKHSSAYFQLGLIAMAEGDKVEAENIGKKLESIDPDFAEDYKISLGLIPQPQP